MSKKNFSLPLIFSVICLLFLQPHSLAQTWTDHVFTLGPGQDIYELRYGSIGGSPVWSWTNVSQLIFLSVGSPSWMTGFYGASSPECTGITPPVTFLYFAGTNQHVYQFVGNHTPVFCTSDLTQITASPVPATSSRFTSFNDSLGNHVFYEAGNGHIYQLYYENSASKWLAQDLTTIAAGPLAATGTALTSFSDSPGEHVIYLGGNQHVYQLFGTNGTWISQDLTAMSGGTLSVAGSALTSFVDSFGEHIAHIGTNGHVYQLYGENGGWQDQDLTSMSGASNTAATNTGLTSFVDSFEHIIYLGTNQHVYQLYTTTVWVNQDLTSMSGASNTAAAGSQLGSFVVGSSEHVYYFGPPADDYHVYELGDGGSGWGNKDLTALTGEPEQNTGSPIVAFTCKIPSGDPGCQ